MLRIFKNFCRSAVTAPSQVRYDWGIMKLLFGLI